MQVKDCGSSFFRVVLSFTFALGVTGVACDGAYDEDELGSRSQAIAADGTLDPELPNSEPLPDDVVGPPIPVTPGDPGLIARQSAHLAKLAREKARWQRQGKSRDQVEALTEALKDEDLGEQP